MSEKRAQKTREEASPLVDAGETVRHAVRVTTGPLFALLLGPLGVAFMKFRTIALTDETLYVMPMKATGAPKEVEQRIPRGSVAVSTGNSPIPLQSTLVIGGQTWNVAKPFKDEAERLAAAASAP